MKKYVLGVAGVLAVAGSVASAQTVTVDGTRDGAYGPAQWVNPNPTQFGDNRQDNVPPPGNPADVDRGIELVIPLSAIGGGTNIRLAGFVTSGDHGFASNQTIGGLPSNRGNLGEVRNLNFNTFANNQFINLAPAAAATAPAVDGVLERSIYGSAKFVQTTFTQFGNATHGTRFLGSGSEIDGIYAVTNGGNLYLFVAGNLEANFNKLQLFFDTIAGGQNRLVLGNNAIDNALPRLSDDGSGNGLTFDTGFEADFYLNVAGGDVGGGAYGSFLHFAELPTGGAGNGFFLGSNDGVGPALSGGDVGAPAVQFSIDNSNIQGVNGTPPVSLPSADDSVGSEISNFAARVADDTLYLFFGGNLQTNYNKLVIFVDVGNTAGPNGADPGQNILRGDNVDIDFNGLNRLGTDLNDPTNLPGLTFDSDFSADQYIAMANGNSNPVSVFMNAATLRADGPIKLGGTFNADYGSYDGGEKPATPPHVLFDGPQFDTPGGNVNIYSQYAPRSSYLAFPNTPAAQQIVGAVNNSNVDGVTDTAADPIAARIVSTGMEFGIALSELGYQSGPIKVAAFIASDNYGFLSNQILGAPAGLNNLGEPRTLNFNNVEGLQYILVRNCPGDFNNDGQVDFFDYLDFSNAFSVEDPSADFNNDGQVDFFDFLDYAAAFSDESCQ
ncbi:MAG: hypothetical protein SFZ23_09710 [Planctomycetota bacterium]|nr:hypothetical protein [Planctomycetota bacterium]